MQQELIRQLYNRSFNNYYTFPDKELLEVFIDKLFRYLFMPLKGDNNSIDNLTANLGGLRNTFSALLFDVVPDKDQVTEATDAFFDALGPIYSSLIQDATSIYQFDPAADSVEEVMVAYPGFYATAVYRFAHQLHLQQVPTIPRLLSEYAHSRTGIDIHPAAEIGVPFFIDHGTGLVIGESTIIGDNVKIYQGVTIGALNVLKGNAKQKRHPTIEDNVIIYSGATILGGETIVGHDSIIGGNVWLTNSVLPFSVVYHKSEVVVRDKFLLAEPLNFII